MRLPAQIAALPQTAAGIPVTWAAAWSSEIETLEVKPDPLLESATGQPFWAYFTQGKQGLGNPCINYPHPERVRKCAIEGRCQVCGRHLPLGPRWICDLRLGQDTFRYHQKMVPLLVDSWTCNDCIDFSLRSCPNLSRRTSLRVLRVAEWMVVPTMERPKWIPPEIPYGPIGFVKIAALSYTQLTTCPVALGRKGHAAS